MSSGEDTEVARDRMRKYEERRERVAVSVERTSLAEFSMYGDPLRVGTYACASKKGSLLCVADIMMAV